MPYALTPAQWERCRVRRIPGNRRSRRIATGNRKGGSGKTSTLVHLAAALARWGARVRICDCDAQLASLTIWLPPAVRGFRTLLDVYMEEKKLADVTYPTSIDNLWLIPSLETLGQVEIAQVTGAELLLRESFDAEPNDYDVELLDTGPNIGKITVSTLVAADAVILSVGTSTLDQIGVVELERQVEVVKRRLNPGLEVIDVVLVNDNARTNLSQDLVAHFRGKYPAAPVHQVPHSIRMAEAPGEHKPVYDHAPDNPTALAYWNLAADLVPSLGLEWEVSPDDVLQQDRVAA